LTRPGAECGGAPFKLGDLGVPVQVQVDDRRSRPGRRLVILDALHHENHTARPGELGIGGRVRFGGRSCGVRGRVPVVLAAGVAAPSG
jgi:hypothetical protein